MKYITPPHAPAHRSDLFNAYGRPYVPRAASEARSPTITYGARTLDSLRPTSYKNETFSRIDTSVFWEPEDAHRQQREGRGLRQ